MVIEQIFRFSDTLRLIFTQWEWRGHHLFQNDAVDDDIRHLDNWFALFHIHGAKIWQQRGCEYLERENLQFHQALEEFYGYARQQPIVLRVDAEDHVIEIWSAHFVELLHRVATHRQSKAITIVLPLVLKPVTDEFVIDVMRRGRAPFEWRYGSVGGILNMVVPPVRDELGMVRAPTAAEIQRMMEVQHLAESNWRKLLDEDDLAAALPDPDDSSAAVVTDKRTRHNALRQANIHVRRELPTPTSGEIIRRLEKGLMHMVLMQAYLSDDHRCYWQVDVTSERWHESDEFRRHAVSAQMLKQIMLAAARDDPDLIENCLELDDRAGGQLRQVVAKSARRELNFMSSRFMQNELNELDELERLVYSATLLPPPPPPSANAVDEQPSGVSTMSELEAGLLRQGTALADLRPVSNRASQARYGDVVISWNRNDVDAWLRMPLDDQMHGHSSSSSGSLLSSSSDTIESSVPPVSSSSLARSRRTTFGNKSLREHFKEALHTMVDEDERARNADPLQNVKSKLLIDTVHASKRKNEIRLAAERFIYGLDVDDLLRVRLTCEAHRDFWYADYGADSDSSPDASSDEDDDDEADGDPAAAPDLLHTTIALEDEERTLLREYNLSANLLEAKRVSLPVPTTKRKAPDAQSSADDAGYAADDEA